LVDGDEELARARVGQTIGGRWRLDRVIGVGGMAAVYEARDALGAVVALKLLHPEVAVKRDVRERFLREGYVANHLGHPGVVRALEHGDGGPDGVYLAMELLIGETLAARVKRHGRLPVAELIDYADQVLDVLIVAHEKGIVHRDLKPDNLFVTGEGRIKILDFGLARLLDGVESNHKTRTGLALGTLPYMAPEQALGRRNEIDGRVDLFALGATMFRILSGRKVHEANSEAELLMAMASRPAPPLKSVAPETPDGLCSVVDLALAFSRDARYPDARTMQADLRAVRAGQAPSYATSRFSAREEATRADRPAPSLPRHAEPSPHSQRATVPLSAYGGGAAAAAAPALGATLSPAHAPPLGTTLPPASAPALGATLPPAHAPPLGTTLPPASAPALGATLPPAHAPPLGTTLPPASVAAPHSFAQTGTPYPAPASTHFAPQPPAPLYAQAPSFTSAVPMTASAPGQPAPGRRRSMVPVLGALAAVLTLGGAAGVFLLTRSSGEASAPSDSAPHGALEMMATSGASPPAAAESGRALHSAATTEPEPSGALRAPAAALERTAATRKASDEETTSPATSAALAPSAQEPPSGDSPATGATAPAETAEASPQGAPPPSPSPASAPAPPTPAAPKAAPPPPKPASPSKKGSKPKKAKL
jgi:serine/threonine protein kinase